MTAEIPYIRETDYQYKSLPNTKKKTEELATFAIVISVIRYEARLH